MACVLLLSAWTLPSSAAKLDEGTRLLEKSCSLHGLTGWINLPSASVPGENHLSAAIHRGDVKLNVGLWNFLEAGVYVEVDQLGARSEKYRYLSSWEKVQSQVPEFVKENFFGQAKLKLLDQDWAGVSLAGGIERQDTFVVAQRYFGGTSRVTLLGGWGTGRFAKGFGGLSKTIMPGAELTFEYDGQGMNTGIRMLLAQNVVFNLAIQDMNTVGEVQNLGEVIGKHLLFGITYLERL